MLSHLKDSALIAQELIVSKSPEKDYDGILASRLPTPDIIPSRGRGRRGRWGEQGKEAICIMARHPECHLQSVGHSCQGSLPLSFVSVQKLYT